MFRRRAVLFVLLFSGLLGFRLGMVAFPDWQVAVETAQVVAGIVHYPEATPFSIYHAKLWTLLHQVLAVFLHFGVSEIQLSLIVSGVLGMVSFQALALFVYAFSRNVPIAVGAVLVIAASRASEFGAIYPIYLMGASHTYGIIGLSWFVLVVSLFGCGAYRAGGFLLGLAPAIHPSLGFWLFIVVAMAGAWNRTTLRDLPRPALAFFAAGSAITGVSLLVHLTFASGTHAIPPIDSAQSAKYLSAFVQLWDAHRRPVGLGFDEVWLNACALTMAAIWLMAFTATLPREATFVLRVVIVTATISLALVVLSWVSPARVPTTLLVLMPTRLLNFNAMTFVALLLGLAWTRRESGWRQPFLMLLFAGGLLVSDRSRLWPWLNQRAGGTAAPIHGIDIWLILEAVAVTLVVLTMFEWNRRRPSAESKVLSGIETMAFATAHGALIVLFAALAVIGLRLNTPPDRLLFDRTNSPLFHEAAVTSARSGLLLTGGNLHLVQLRTRRPVLVDGGGLDGLPYALDSGPQVEDILREVYDIDFFNPPDEARATGMIPSDFTKTHWESFALERWKAIKDRYHVTSVLTSAGWTLSLPVVAQDRHLRLYAIPD